MKIKNEIPLRKKWYSLFFVTLALTLTSCTAQPGNVPEKNTRVNITNTQKNDVPPANLKSNTLTQLRGKVNFQVKSSQNDVNSQATVSLVYLSGKLRNSTIATSVTDDNGEWVIDLHNPEEGVVYALEAVKRLGPGGRTGEAGDFHMGLRTYVRWTEESGWESMIAPFDIRSLISDVEVIEINSQTTALAIISDLNPQFASPEATIGAIPSGGFDCGVQFTVSNGLPFHTEVCQVEDLVNQSLDCNHDPIATIFYDQGYTKKPYPGGCNGDG